MVKYDDLFNTPFVINGRDPKTGLDCYGACIVLAKRAGKVLKDFITRPDSTVKAEDFTFYAMNLNIELIDKPEPNAIAQFVKDGVLHLCYYLDPKTVGQMTYKGFKVHPAFIVESQRDYILMRIKD